MRAVVHTTYGGPEVFRLEEVDKPVPADDEVLIRVRATTMNRNDCAWRSAHPFFMRAFGGVLRPKHRILGTEVAGEVEAVGASVSEFAVGDRVFGAKAYLDEGFGAHAEYVCMRAAGALAHMPAGASFEEMAPVSDGGLCALAGIRGGDIRAGRTVVVYGASGSIGTSAVQLAKHFGADVTAVCGAENLELARSLGADDVLDYRSQDFTRKGTTYDVVYDAVGKLSFRGTRGALKPGGVYLPTDGMVNFPLSLLTKRFGDKRVVFAIPRYSKENVLLLKELVENGRYRAVLDRTYPLEQAVEAARYVDTHQKVGNVVLTVNHDVTVGPR